MAGRGTACSLPRGTRELLLFEREVGGGVFFLEGEEDVVAAELEPCHRLSILHAEADAAERVQGVVERVGEGGVRLILRPVHEALDIEQATLQHATKRHGVRSLERLEVAIFVSTVQAEAKGDEVTVRLLPLVDHRHRGFVALAADMLQLHPINERALEGDALALLDERLQ